MNDELRQRIIERLKRGDELPREWALELFPPEKMEYELTYHGKERESEIIANTMAVPLQKVRTFGGGNTDDWHNMLILGDNLQVLKRLLEYKKEGRLSNADGTIGVRLVYIDPPFATMQEFAGKENERAYSDKLLGAQFIEFIRKRLVILRDLLTDDGSLFLHLDTKKSHYMKVILDEVFGEANFRNEIIWKRQSAHNDSSKCGAIHDTILFYTKSSNWVWNEVLTPPRAEYIEQFFDQVEPITNRRYARGDLSAGGLSGGGYEYEFRGIRHVWRAPKSTLERLDAEGRLHWPKKGVPRLKRYLDEFEGVPLQDIWDDIRVIHNRSVERTGYPTQKPEMLLERVIKASSNPGDLVLDCFLGSGTTVAVAEKLGRRWVGIDRGKLAIYTVQKRMINIKSEIGSKGKHLEPKPFTLYNAGLYDFSTLNQLPREDWRFFALQLFECKDDIHTIGGLELDGKRRGSSVLVFNHHKNPKDMIDEDAILSIHRRIGDKIGRSFYIIAPRHTFAFQQDYLTFDDVRYYALRIPYSFINELHRREFSALQQPQDETAVNELIDAEGFDFIQVPTVDYKVGIEKRSRKTTGSAFIKLEKFESKARIRGGLELRFMDAFSMLLLDFDYNGQVFQLHKYVYAKDMEANYWRAWFPIEAVGNKVMAVFMDIYGNEATQIITRDEFEMPYGEE